MNNNVLNFTDCGGNTVSVDAVKYNAFKEKMNGSTFNRAKALAVGKDVGLSSRAIRFGVLVDSNRIGTGKYSMNGIASASNEAPV